ncbi:bifunctional 4-hydroxy-2-oxoglutarate aldolase/2-dehydro-3-deoxy-phosphogluconate aldolase [soil metagenome]
MVQEVMKKITDARIIAVLVIEKPDHAIPLVRALVTGGVDIIELTLRTPVAIDAAQAIKKATPEMTLGFGTVITTEQVKAVVDAGADFAVAPGCNPKVIDEAYKQGLSFAPGIMTPTDIEIAVDHGCRLLKYFPAEAAGGMDHLVSMVTPYQYLGLKFIPLGGCNINNAESYLASPLIAAIGGSWIANPSLIQAENWAAITENARAIKELIKKVKVIE